VKPYWFSCVVLFALAAAPQVPARTPSDSKPPSALEQTSIEQTSIENEKDLIAAKKKDDASYFKRTLSRDFSLVGIDGMLLQGEAAEGNLGDSSLVELTPYDMEVVPLGDNGAIVTYDAIVREAPEEDQGPPPRYQHFTSVWVKQGSQWRLKFHQATAEHWGDW
jgi:hypothetical protein